MIIRKLKRNENISLGQGTNNENTVSVCLILPPNLGF